MLGLIFAALYTAFAIVANNTSPIAAVELTLGFLWYWHVVFSCIIGFILLAVPFIGLVVMVNGNKKNKTIGAALLLGSPIILFLGALMPALFLGAVYAIDSGIQDGEVVNQNNIIVGGILYGIAILGQIIYRSSQSK